MAYKFFIKGIRRFNAEKVLATATDFLHGKDEGNDMNVFYLENEEANSVTFLIKNFSPQGVTVTFHADGKITVDLPWIASLSDVRFCYAYLNAVKRIYRGARIVDEDDKEVKIAFDNVRQQWFKCSDNIAEILERGEDAAFSGWRRDFFIHPACYDDVALREDKVAAVFADFARLQWATDGYEVLPEELRHVSEDEELSSLRVADNTKKCFIGKCSYVGLMCGNSCKIVKTQYFYSFMEHNDFFYRMDYEQAVLDPMPEEAWERLFDELEGSVVNHFRKTFIMRWNTDISSYRMADFEDSMKKIHDEGFYYDWSIWDFEDARVGDRFYMIRTGDGINGIVMRGSLMGTPYADEDWSGRGRRVCYVRMALSHLIHPDKATAVLTTEELSEAIPDFNWKAGHSGELLTDRQASQLDALWEKYLERMHQLDEEGHQGKDFSKYFKESVRVRNPYYDNQGEHISTIMEPDYFLTHILPNVGSWQPTDVVRTKVNFSEYDGDEADVFAVRIGGDMGMKALLLNDETQRRIFFVCAYPMHRGMKHRLRIKKAVEWESRIEALVFAENDEMDITFFATDYYANKHRYVPGSELEIDLAACGYRVEENEPEFVMDAETSARMRKDMGVEDENGNVLPMTLSNQELVAYLPINEKYPDNVEFASPVKSAEEVSLFGIDFIKAVISINHEPEETYIPLYFKKEWLPEVTEGTLLRGIMWMQGNISK